MKYYPRLKIWKRRNVKLDPETLESWSYDWWKVTRRIGPYLVFNDYHYSRTTSSHQSEIRSLFWNELKNKIKHLELIFIECPKGADDLSRAIEHYKNKIEQLTKELANPRIRKVQERVDLRTDYQNTLEQIKELRVIERKTEDEREFDEQMDAMLTVRR